MSELTNEDRAIIRYALRQFGSGHIEFATAAAQEGALEFNGRPYSKEAISSSVAVSKRAFELIAEFQDTRAKPEHEEG